MGMLRTENRGLHRGVQHDNDPGRGRPVQVRRHIGNEPALDSIKTLVAKLLGSS